MHQCEVCSKFPPFMPKLPHLGVAPMSPPTRRVQDLATSLSPQINPNFVFPPSHPNLQENQCKSTFRLDLQQKNAARGLPQPRRGDKTFPCLEEAMAAVTVPSKYSILKTNH